MGLRGQGRRDREEHSGREVGAFPSCSYEPTSTTGTESLKILRSYELNARLPVVTSHS